ncbi:putative transcriptional regulator [Rhodococcus erythropolis]|uniref:CBS domain-containing protein n=1 Tax=Rhodococcus erythropolis TaxID=1833 RepID=UPI002166DCBB|nr:CBS domain-containing protein [Rhodococcus erythropolis]MCS4253046.1 putative transcriptional regulator [Rhodococcus erythropolis]MCW2428509.1 putative transcriptional regulator [Rhodococcus erythropolis]
MKANQNTQDGNSLAGKQVRDIMINCPKWVDSTITIGHAEKLFTDEHVHMLLLVEDRQLVGTLVRTDLHHDPLPRELPAKPFSAMKGRWVHPDHDATDLLTWMSSQRIRRLAVVDETLNLKGLVCLKRTGTGFCSDANVEARASSTQIQT